MTTEAQLQAAVLLELGALPKCLIWRNNTGAAHDGRRLVRYGVPGSADILGVWEGRAIAVEVKSARGKLSKIQRTWRDAWEAAGGVYVLARAVAGEPAEVTAAYVAREIKARVFGVL